MADTVDSVGRSRIMAKVRSRDTLPELRVRRLLHAAGFRFRLRRSDLPGNPDLVLPRYRLAVFVHGCFWHWHGCKRSRMPHSNREYWCRKIERNVERDAERMTALEAHGWTYYIIWECSIQLDVDQLVRRLRQKAPRVAAADPLLPVDVCQSPDCVDPAGSSSDLSACSASRHASRAAIRG